MSKKILELSTKKSLYKPIVIRVDGKEYESAMITTELFEKIAVLDKEAKKGDIKAVAEQLTLIFKVPVSVARKLDLRDMSFDALAMITDAVVNPEKVEKEQQGDSKNGARPGDKELVKSPPSTPSSPNNQGEISIGAGLSSIRLTKISTISVFRAISRAYISVYSYGFPLGVFDSMTG